MSKEASARVTIENRLGLHARPAMLFAETASNFTSDITVQRTDGKEPVDGKSIMQLMMLAATQGTELDVSATGDDAQFAVDELVKLIKGHFMEE